MNDEELERSESGNPIYRHAPREEGWQIPAEDCCHLEEIEVHIEQHIGKVETVFHELVSDLIHLDVLFVPATDKRPWHCLITSGVSDLPMTVPEGAEEFRRAELVLALPPDWPLNDAAFKDEANYWPVRWLKMIGRLPHEYKTWIGWGHTIPNGDPARPIANTQFTGVMLAPPYWLGPDFFGLDTKDGEKIHFFTLVPLYREEMDFKLSKGADALEEKFESADIGFVIDPQRVNVAKKKGWFGRG